MDDWRKYDWTPPEQFEEPHEGDFPTLWEALLIALTVLGFFAAVCVLALLFLRAAI